MQPGSLAPWARSAAWPLVLLALVVRASRPALGPDLFHAGVDDGWRGGLARGAPTEATATGEAATEAAGSRAAAGEAGGECPAAARTGTSPWRYSVRGCDNPRARHLHVGDVYELSCDGEILEGNVQAHVEHNADRPVDSELVLLIGRAAREALRGRSCAVARVVVRGSERPCLARLPIPSISWWPLSTHAPRWHMRRLFYNLPVAGSGLRDFFADLDEEEPLIADVIELLAIVMTILGTAGLIIRGCWSAASGLDELVVMVPPKGLLMPSADEVTKKIFKHLGLFIVDLLVLICVVMKLQIIRKAGYTCLYLLLLPLIIGPAAVWRASMAWHRICSFHLCLCSERRLLFDSSLGLSGRWVAVNLLVPGLLLARLVAIQWWLHNDFDGLQAAGAAFVIGRIVFKIWQNFSAIVAMETELTKCQVDIELLVRSDADEEKSPPVLPGLTNVTESASLVMSRAGAEGKGDKDAFSKSTQDAFSKFSQGGEGDENSGEEIDARFSLLDAVRLSSTLSRCERGSAGEGKNSRLAGAVPDVSVLIVASLAVASVAIGIQYVASFPELTLSMTTAHMRPRFSPNTREYDLLLDSGQPELELFLQCDPERVSQLEVQWPGRPALLEGKTCSSLNKTATRHLFPAVVNSTVEGGLWATDYKFWVRPIRLLAKSLVLRGTAGEADFSRCIHWGEIPGTSLSLPQDASDLSLEIATHAYEIELPVDLRNQTSLPKDPKTFFTGFLEELSAEQCAEYCRDHPTCVTHVAVNAGCYVVVGPPDCWEHHKNTRRVEDMKDEDVRKFIKEWSLKGQLCFPSQASGERCKEMDASLRDGVLALNDSEKLIEYVNEEADGTLRITASANQNVSLYTGTTGIRFRRGTPQLLAMPAELWLPGGQRKTPKVVMSNRPSITVELPEYELAAMTGVTRIQLRLAPLLEDPGFLAGLFGNGTRARPLEGNDGNFTESCRQSPGLRRFRACGGLRENGGHAISIELDPWRPSGDDLVVKIEPRPELQRVFHPVEVPVRVVTVSGEEPLQWLIRRSCVTDADETLYTPKVVGELAACCSTRGAVEKLRSFLLEHANDAEEVAAVLLRVEDNPDASRVLSELGDAVPAAALPELARRNATAATIVAACRNAGDLEFPAILGQVPKDRLASIQPCLVNRDLVALLARSVLASCAPCAKAVGGAFPKSQATLKFMNHNLGDHEQVIALAAGIGEMKSVRALHLSGNTLGSRGHLGLEVLGAALAKMPKLTSLDLSGNALGENPGDMEAFSPFLANLTQLTELGLFVNDLGIHPGDVKALCAALAKMTKLTFLHLGQNSLGNQPGAAVALGAALANMPKMTSLNLGANWLGRHPGAVEALSAGLAKMTDLKSLNLPDNELGEHPGAVEAISAALTKMTKLVELYVFSNDLGTYPGDAEVFCAALAKMTQMTKLMVYGNDLGELPGGTEALSVALARMPKLTQLNLRRLALGKHPGSVKAFSAALATMTQLTELTLSINSLGEHPGAVETLGAALAKLTKLTVLRIDDNILGKHRDAVKAFSAGLAKAPNMTTLNLGRNDLGKHTGATEALGAVLANMTKLVEVGLGHDPDVLQAFSRMLPKRVQLIK